MGETLSKTALFILGIIAQNPTNPYAMSKLVNFKRRNIRDRIPTQTVYGIINMLSKKGLITGKRTKNGNMPDRTIYSATARGKKLIREDLVIYLSNPEGKLTELLLSIILIGYLDKETVLRSLREHQEKIEAEITIHKKFKSQGNGGAIPVMRQIGIDHMINSLKVDLKTVKDLINAIDIDPEWAKSTVPWWRDDFLEIEKSRKRKRTAE